MSECYFINLRDDFYRLIGKVFHFKRYSLKQVTIFAWQKSAKTSIIRCAHLKQRRICMP